MKGFLVFVVGSVVALVSIILLGMYWGHITGDFFLMSFAILGTMGALWVHENTYTKMWTYIARLGMIAGGLTLFGIALPGIKAFFFSVKGSWSDWGQEQALLVETPQKVPCVGPFFIGKGKKARARLYHEPGNLCECFDKPGNHPENNRELTEYREDAIAALKAGVCEKPKLVPPTPAPSPAQEEPTEFTTLPPPPP